MGELRVIKRESKYLQNASPPPSLIRKKEYSKLFLCDFSGFSTQYHQDRFVSSFIPISPKGITLCDGYLRNIQLLRVSIFIPGFIVQYPWIFIQYRSVSLIKMRTRTQMPGQLPESAYTFHIIGTIRITLFSSRNMWVETLYVSIILPCKYMVAYSIRQTGAYIYSFKFRVA